MTTPIRVLMVSQRFLPHDRSGAPLQALLLARALNAIGGVRASVVTTRHQRDQPVGDYAVEGVPVRVLATVASCGAAALRASQWAAMAGHVTARRFDIDVVHGHALSASVLGALCGAKACGMATVVKQSLAGPEGDLSKIRRSPAAPLLLAALRSAERFAVISDEIADELRAVGVDASKLWQTRNGVDTGRFRAPADADEQVRERARLGLSADAPVVLFAGQLVWRKGIDVLLDAWPAVRCSWPSAQLLVAGAGPQRARVLEACAAERAGVHHLGVRDDIPALMRAADVFVLPSRAEGCVNVALEALASGLPVVIGEPALPSALSWSDGDELGYSVDPQRADDVARAVCAALSSRPRRLDLAGARRQRIEPFHIDALAHAYRALYRELVA